MSFTNILGHRRQLEVIRRSIISGQIPPAYLFHGEEGIGKRLVAVRLAKALNCTGEHAPGESCGACQSCRNIEAGCHPNVSAMALEVNEKTGKLRQQITIDQVRKAQEYLSLRAVGQGSKVLIVDGAHQMNEEAANAFLKTLEEPPGNSHVVLVTSRPSYLLQTIHSRCRSVGFAPLPVSDVTSALMDMRGLEEGEASLLSRMTGGRLGAALAADPADIMSRRGAFLDTLDGLAASDDKAVLDFAESASKTGEELDDLVFFGRLWFRDLLIILVGGGMELAYNRDMAGELEGWSGRVTPYGCESVLRLLAEAGRAMERTINRRLMAEALFFRIREEVLA